MSPGKAAAQSAHALASLNRYKSIYEFSNSVKRTIIVLEAVNENQIKNLELYLRQLEIPAASYIDEGINEITPYMVTALAIGPLGKDDIDSRYLLNSFPLYPTERKVDIFKRKH